MALKCDNFTFTAMGCDLYHGSVFFLNFETSATAHMFYENSCSLPSDMHVSAHLKLCTGQMWWRPRRIKKKNAIFVCLLVDSDVTWDNKLVGHSYVTVTLGEKDRCCSSQWELQHSTQFTTMNTVVWCEHTKTKEIVQQFALIPDERLVQFRQETTPTVVYITDRKLKGLLFMCLCEQKTEKDWSAFVFNRRPVTSAGICCGTLADRGPGWARGG